METWDAVQAENHGLKEQLAEAHQPVEEWKKHKTPVVDFVKANVVKPKAAQEKARKRRDAKHNHAWRREEPTRIVEHRIPSCSVCASRLGGVS